MEEHDASVMGHSRLLTLPLESNPDLIEIQIEFQGVVACEPGEPRVSPRPVLLANSYAAPMVASTAGRTPRAYAAALLRNSMDARRGIESAKSRRKTQQNQEAGSIKWAHGST